MKSSKLARTFPEWSILLKNLKEKRKIEETCTKYAGSAKFNGIPREGNLEIPTKYHKDQYHEHMIRNVIRYVLSLTYPHNKDKRWDLLLQKYIFPFDYMKRHIKILHKGYNTDEYVVQNLTWSGVYLWSTFSNALVQKVLTLVLLTSTGPEVFVSIMATFLSDYYDALEETINHMKSLKLKIYLGENFIDFCASILVDADCIDITGAFKHENLGYITRILEDNYDSRFLLWEILKYKEVTEFIKKNVCVVCMSYHQRISSRMIPFYKRLRVNNATLLIQSGGNRISDMIILNTNIPF